jgi:hypothetical protein
MRGPSTQDCEKSYARTGVPSENLKSKLASPRPANSTQLIQIKGLQPMVPNLSAIVAEEIALGA